MKDMLPRLIRLKAAHVKLLSRIESLVKESGKTKEQQAKLDRRREKLQEYETSIHNLETYGWEKAPNGNPRVGADLQEFRIQVREFDTGQTGTPTARIELWENGTLVRAGTDTDVTSQNQVIAFTWNASELATADGSLVQCNFVGTKSGGSPGARNTVDYGAVEWNVDYTAASGVEVIVPLGTFTFAGLVPSVVTGVNVIAPLKTYSFAGLLPTVETGVTVATPLGTYVFAGFEPSIVTGVNVVVPLNTFAFAGFIPTVNQVDINIQVPLNTFTFAGLLPIISTGVNVVTPLNTFSFAGVIPSIVTGANVIVPLNTFSFTGLLPTVVTVGGVSVVVPLGAYTFAGLLPTISAAAPVEEVIILGFGKFIEDEVWSKGRHIQELDFMELTLPHTHPVYKPIKLSK